MAEANTAARKDAGSKKTAPRRAKSATAGGKRVKVRLLKSGIGTPKDQRATLRGLGLTHLHQERDLLDTPAVRGMLTKVRHLVSVDGQPVAAG
jgi:large subunit ribosomal protein L30